MCGSDCILGGEDLAQFDAHEVPEHDQEEPQHEGIPS